MEITVPVKLDVNLTPYEIIYLCKAGVELLEAYSEIHAKSKYAYINGCI